ncbi:MAG: hypothetical protein IPK78_13310 [Rhodospirillales bacterium]|nr:hypothetical protein [Rhodospirillales bacterium]
MRRARIERPRHTAFVLYPQRFVERVDGDQGVAAASPQMLDRAIDRGCIA